MTVCNRKGSIFFILKKKSQSYFFRKGHAASFALFHGGQGFHPMRARCIAPLPLIETIIGPSGDVVINVVHDFLKYPPVADDVFMKRALPDDW